MPSLVLSGEMISNMDLKGSQHSALLQADVRSHLFGSSAIQSMTASEESCHPHDDDDDDDDDDDGGDGDGDGGGDGGGGDDDDDDDYKNDSAWCRQGEINRTERFT